VTITKLTQEFIQKNPSIKDCLRKGLINYSALSRLISKEQKGTTKEAILIAARRYKEKIFKQPNYENKIKTLLKNTEIEVKNKIFTLQVEKRYSERTPELQKKIAKEQGIFYQIEGSSAITLISSDRYKKDIKQIHKNYIINESENLVLVILKSGKEIEHIPGVVAYLYSLFAENNINIIEEMSCWTDTLFVVKEKDLNKIIELLKF